MGPEMKGLVDWALDMGIMSSMAQQAASARKKPLMERGFMPGKVLQKNGTEFVRAQMVHPRAGGTGSSPEGYLKVERDHRIGLQPL
jgi:hypothetical protein